MINLKRTKKSKPTEGRLLTDVELELMTVLWKRGEGTVADVLTQLSPGRDLKYTSVSTVLRILESKKFLIARKEGRGHVYIPNVPKSEYEARTLKHVVNRVFDGTPVALVKQLIGSSEIDQSELDQIKRLIKDARLKS